MPGYSREQLLDVRRLLRAEANAGSLGISSSVVAPSGGEIRTVTVVKKKVRAASAGDAIKSSSTFVSSSTTAGPAPSMNVWEQRRLAAAAQKKPQEIKPSAVASSSTAVSSTAPAAGGFTVTSSSQGAGSMSLAEQYLQADANSFSADERAKLAQLREHLKNRTLASQLRPIATEFRPTQQKHWSREWNKPADGETSAAGFTPVKAEKKAKAIRSEQDAATTQQAAPSGPKSWSQIVNPRAKTAEPSTRVPKKVKVQPAVVSSNHDDMRMTVEAVDPVATKRVLGKIRANSSNKRVDASRSPSKRRVPPPRTIGQLRQSNVEDLPVDFRDLIPTTDVTGKRNPINWKVQREKMRAVAKILLERDEKRKQQIATAKKAAKNNAAASGNAIDAINARADAVVKKPKGRPPTFREHVASRAKSAIVRPIPVARVSRRAQSRGGVPQQQSEEQPQQDKQQETAQEQMETQRRQQQKKSPTSWENYLPDLKEFPEDYAALFADWSYNDHVTESKLQRVTDDVKLMQEFTPNHVELLVDPETGVQEEYTMMWVEGTYRRIPVSVVTPELIRRSKEAEKIYGGIDTQRMSPKRAASLQKRTAPIERKERKSRRDVEVAEIRRKIEKTLEAGLDACDRKAADVLPLAAVMQDKQFGDLTLKQKCEICRARRVRFLKTERLAMVERVASQQNLQVLDVIAVLHAMMSDRIEYKARRKNEVDEMKFARMLAKRDQQMVRLQEAQKQAAENPEPVPVKKTKAPTASNANQTGVVVQPLQESEEELRKRVAARKKHLQIAMRTPGYQIWLKLKDSKDAKYKVKYPVTTPVPEQLCSKRAWDGLVRQWRQRLHQYDQFAPEILGRPVYDRDEVAAHRASNNKATPPRNGRSTPPLAVIAADELPAVAGKTSIEMPSPNAVTTATA